MAGDAPKAEEMRTGGPPVAPGSVPTNSGDAVGVWLDGLVRVMRLPAGESAEIRDELDSHIRERVRDLMLVGESEPRAIHHAIRELGDAALLAQRYREARKTRTRRPIMTVAALTLATSALILSTATLTGGRVRSSAPPTAPGTQSPAFSDEGLEEVLSSPMGLEEDATYGDMFGMISDAAGGSVVDWEMLDQLGIDRDEEMGFSTNGGTIEQSLWVINRRFGDDGIALVAVPTGVEITTQHELDRRATELVAYDIEDIMDEGIEAEEVTGLMTEFVEPDIWVDNGGDLASYQIVGPRLFVSAPTRILPRIEWMLDEVVEREVEDDEVGVGAH